jgi:hypothetical protein
MLVGHFGRRTWVVALVATSALVAVGAATLVHNKEGSGPPPEEPRRAVTPEGVSYPHDWLASLQEASNEATFELFIPDSDPASTKNLQTTYLYPGGQAVAMDFPAQPTSSPVRQEYIEVWESAWSGGDPAEFLATSAKIDAASKELLLIDDVTILSVSAHAEADPQHANPALLRFDMSGTDVQISGGDDTAALIEIARSIISQAPGK